MPVKRSMRLAAPQRGDAVHVVGLDYLAATGSRMIESVTLHAFDGNYYFTRQSYRRVSEDNGKTWTTIEPIFATDPSKPKDIERTPGRHFLDPRPTSQGKSGAVLCFYSDWLIRTSEPQFASDTSAKSYRIYYRASFDEGHTWGPVEQVIHHGPGYDSTRWLPMVTYGINGAYVESAPPMIVGDGAIAVPIVIAPLDREGKLYNPHRSYWYEVGVLRGRWASDGRTLQWEIGEPIRVGLDESSIGCCEPDLATLRDGRVFMTLRCQGNPGAGKFPSSRRWTVSRDHGMTWSKPELLRYDDGQPVHVPASFSALVRSPVTGKLFWFANILDEPAFAQYPRCPLTVAQIDEDRCCVIRDSVRIVQDLPPGAPPCTNRLPTTDEECGRQYTNFGCYVDRLSKEIVITVPEMPKTTWAEFTSDCIELRMMI